MWRSIHFTLLQRVSESLAHACACLCCANGKAFLRGMQQAAFLKAIGKFLLLWELPALSQANEKPKIAVKLEEKCLLIDFRYVWNKNG